MNLVPHDYSFVFARINLTKKNDCIVTLAEWLKYWLRFKRLCGEMGTVVFDIDDTLVDEEERLIMPMFDVYKLAIRLGFEVNIVTARPESRENRKATRDMLHENGIDRYEALYMMPANIQPTAASMAKYKYEARRDIARRHRILANCGDMWTDHCKLGAVKELQYHDNDESVICFLPNMEHPSIKMPGKI